MAPIKVAIIGLSASAVTGWASRAHLPYLLSASGRKRYRIVALCNSSIDAAKAAIRVFELPAETKAYGDPEILARDPNIELVVCNTRVDKHYETIRPSIEAGKAVFVEWPLAHDIERVRELTDLVRSKGVRSVVGVQGRLAPAVRKLRELLDSGRIGQVLSVEVRAAGGSNDRDVLPLGLKCFAQRQIGGNVFTIGFGHREYSTDTTIVTL
jgi:predicted dehydrogenase